MCEKLKGQRYDLQSISDCVRKRILKWIQNCDALNHLREHKDYFVRVKLDASNQPVVSVLCSSCNKEYKLYSKESTTSNGDTSTFMISNWTNHVKKCFSNKDGKRNKKQHTLFKFLPSANALAQSSPVKRNGESNLDMNLGKPPLETTAAVEAENGKSSLDGDLDKPSIVKSVTDVTNVTNDTDSLQNFGELASDMHSLDENTPSSKLVQPLCTTTEPSFSKEMETELSCKDGTNQGFQLSSSL